MSDPNFHDVQFPADLTDGRGGQSYRGGPMFSTGVLLAESGREQRNINAMRSICKYNVGHIVRDNIAKDKLLAFFNARRGMRYSFRFKDWLDYQCSGVNANYIAQYGIFDPGSGYAIGDTGELDVIYWDGATVNDATYVITGVDGGGGIISFVLTNPGTDYLYVEDMPTLNSGAQPGSGTGFRVDIQAVGIVPATGSLWSKDGSAPYQLAKLYVDPNGYCHFRLISKLCTGAVPDASGYLPPVPQFYLAGAPATPGVDFDLDYTTGELWPAADGGWDYHTTPGSGGTITWTGDFDVHARFETDVQQLLLQNFDDTDWPSIVITEVKDRPRPPAQPIVFLGSTNVPGDVPDIGQVFIGPFYPDYVVTGVGNYVTLRLYVSQIRSVGTDVALSSDSGAVSPYTTPITIPAFVNNTGATFIANAVGTAVVTATFGSQTLHATIKVIG